jgi:orotidine-5'-phosphate decarboxylase
MSLLPPIAVALDTTDLETAVAWAAAAGPHVSTVKVGLELFLRHGHDAVLKCREASGGREVFLDLKLHDIPNTVAGAARSIAELAPDYLTVHASGGPAMVRAAVEVLPGTRVTAVTVLTSLTCGAARGRRLHRVATRRPCAGSRCSRSREVRARWCAHRSRSPTYAGGRPRRTADHTRVRPASGAVADDQAAPGVRPASGSADDQARVATPQQALADGADLLVIGRPITGATDVASAARDLAASLH